MDTKQLHSMPARALIEHFRCPAHFLDFQIEGDLSPDKGYFKFGENVVCYGRALKAVNRSSVPSGASDLFPSSIIQGKRVGLPFDPDEVIDNLRFEKYISPNKHSFLRKIYYWVRPFLTLGARRRIQKFNARNWRQKAFPHWPVDTTVEDLCEKLLILSMKAKGVDEIPFIWYWPEGSPACVMMTHDVETEAGRDGCASLMDLNESFGISASFHLVPEGRYTVSRAFRESFRARGFDTEIQDFNHDGRLFDDRQEFLRRAAAINDYAADYGASGFRAAVLYRNLEWLKDLHFSFDTSVPNVCPLDPQQGGCCTVFPYFIGDMLELPVTTIQDYTLFHLLNERSIELWKSQLELILAKNGLVNFIVHPDYILEPDTRAVYVELLGYLRKLRESAGVWCARPAEVDAWWRLRSKMSVEKEGTSWRIKGQGAERAVLAYARNIDGRLVYEMPDGYETARQASSAR